MAEAGTSKLPSSARVVIVGGGIMGCGLAYHLAHEGWSDVVLLEKAELTSGSTWHAAGQITHSTSSFGLGKCVGYNIDLYSGQLEEETGQSVTWHGCGSFRLAYTEDEMDWLRHTLSVGRALGFNIELVGPEIIAEKHPFYNLDGVLGALYTPDDGHVDPSNVTMAMAAGARQKGVQIFRRCQATNITQNDAGEWVVETEQGSITCEHVVNAGGLWAREVAAMAGVYAPLHPMEHQYIVTDDIPEIYERGQEHPHVMDPARESYLRQEGRGLCIGFYEQPCKPWAVDGTPWNFGHELLPDNFDKITDSIEFAYKRFPVLATAGVKSVIHGPFTFAPDGNPLVGPVPGLRNYWSACGVMAGFSQGGGVGLTLAQWMIEGEPDRDVMAMDVARFGDWIGPGYTRPKVVENYQKRFSVSYPNEELPAARPNRTTPMYDIFSDLGAVWGQQYGLEVVNYFAQEGEPGYETPSFRRSDAFDATGREVRCVRAGVGINELHNFGKYRVTGPRARDWLNRIMAGRIPVAGRLSLTPMLSPRGRLIGDFTVSCLREGAFQLTASYGSQAYHLRWFLQHQEDGVTIENISDKRNGFQITGPKARAVLAACTRDPVDLKFMDVREMTVGMTDCLVQRVSYTGDLGYEIYCDPMAQRQLWDTLWQAGQAHGMVPFGMRAMMSLRLDKFFGSWLSEYSPDYTAAETGLDRFISFKKDADFIGRSVAEAEREKGPSRRLVAFEVAAGDADVNAYEPIWLDDRVQGFCTSGGYSHFAGKSVALGFLPSERIADGLRVEIEILGRMRPATLITTPLFDADGARMRG